MILLKYTTGALSQFGVHSQDRQAPVHSPACPLSASPSAGCQLPDLLETQHSKKEPSMGCYSGEGRLTNTVLSAVATLPGRAQRTPGTVWGRSWWKELCGGSYFRGS